MAQVVYNLSLNLLGKPEVRLNNEPVTGFATTKFEALLYYLATMPGSHSREVLADLLWAETGRKKARRNLAQALSRLRKYLGDVFIIDRLNIGLDEGVLSWLDVTAFEAAVTADKAEANPQKLAEAVDLYRGDFLEGLYVKDALLFEEWLLSQRERLRELAIQALDTLVADAINRARHTAGFEYANRLLDLDPWRESTHRQMMILLARSGRRDAALVQYETCRQILADELGVEPMPETTALYERLKDASTAPPHNLPPSPNSFVGRERELAVISRRLARTESHLVTLVGPGGIGKTRLALEAARGFTQPESRLIEPNFADGIYLVALASVRAGQDLTGSENRTGLSNTIASAIAEAIGLTLRGLSDLQAQLLHHLQAKAMLLIFDNFEHLLTGLTPEPALDLLRRILRDAPQVKLLVTSRERLNLPQEWGIEVEGLAESGAVALFLQRAEQIQVGFTSSNRDKPALRRICRFVDGMPLALELAASWTHLLSCAEIAAHIERNVDFLESRWRNLPQRHRSLRAVFNQTWQMLSVHEQAVFAKLSIFLGGFEQEAAIEIAGASAATLSRLTDKSLIRRSAMGRYDVHELLRQYAAEKLPAGDDDPTTGQTVRQRHSLYFLDFIHQHETQLRSDAPQSVMVRLRLELDNLRQAWQWAVAHLELEPINRSVNGLSRFYDLAGLLQEGEMVFRTAADSLQDRLAVAEDIGRPVIRRIIVKLLIEQARLLNRRGLSDQSVQVMATAAALADEVPDIVLQATTYHQWGESLCYHSEHAAAKTQLEVALSLAQTAGLLNTEAEILRHLGIAIDHLGDHKSASNLYQQALACFRKSNDRRGESLTLTNLGILARDRGAYTEAQTLHEQALKGFRDLNYKWGQGVVLDNLGTVLYDQGAYTQAQTLLLEGLLICREIEDFWGEGYVLNSLANVIREQGDYVTARHYYQQALQLRREIGAQQDEGFTLAELALLLHQTGNHQAALEYSQQALEIGQTVDRPTLHALALTHLGHAQLALGLVENTVQTYQHALQIRHELNEHQAIETLAGLIRAYLAHQDLKQARTHTEALLPHLEPDILCGMRETFRIHLTCYQVLRAGQDARAGDILAAAYRQLHERAAHIEDEVLRRSFLEHIPHHREIGREFKG